MREVDKREPVPTLGAPINRPAPAAPVVRKVTSEVNEIAGRMATEIARNIAAPPDPVTPNAETPLC